MTESPSPLRMLLSRHTSRREFHRTSRQRGNCLPASQPLPPSARRPHSSGPRRWEPLSIDLHWELWPRVSVRGGWFGGGTKRPWITFTGSEFPTSGANSPDPAQDSQASDSKRPLVETRAAFSGDTPPHLGGRVSGSALEPFCRFKNFMREDRQPRRGGAMNRTNEYRAKGFELLSLAESMNDPERRADVLRYARLWMSLTEPIPDLPLRLPYELPPQPHPPTWP